jgi:hypothetical protein
VKEKITVVISQFPTDQATKDVNNKTYYIFSAILFFSIITAIVSHQIRFQQVALVP